jgi:hypothetical protein
VSENVEFSHRRIKVLIKEEKNFEGKRTKGLMKSFLQLGERNLEVEVLSFILELTAR